MLGWIPFQGSGLSWQFNVCIMLCHHQFWENGRLLDCHHFNHFALWHCILPGSAAKAGHPGEMLLKMGSLTKLFKQKTENATSQRTIGSIVLMCSLSSYHCFGIKLEVRNDNMVTVLRIKNEHFICCNYRPL